MPITVLLVDDEVLALKYLSNLIDWEAEGYRIVGTATDGEKALAVYDAAHPQVVISDIRMPYRDGLYLCEQIRQRSGDTAIILLSAYQDFTYAKQAIAYDVSNYILKHELNCSSLLAELQKASKELAFRTKNRMMAREQLLNDLFYGTSQLLQLNEFSHLAKERFTLLMVREDTPFELAEQTGGFHSRPSSPYRESLSQLSGESGLGLEYVADTSVDEHHHVVLLSEKLFSASLRREAVCHAAAVLRQGAEKSLSVLYLTDLAWEQLPQSFRALVYRIRYGIFYGPGYLGPAGDLPVLQDEQPLEVAAELTATERALEQGESETLGCLNHAFALVSKPFWNLYALRGLCLGLRTLYERKAIQRGISPELYCGQCFQLKQLRQRFADAFTMLSREEGNVGSCSALIQRAVAYINTHYPENLTLETMGALFGVHGNYLGQLFKQETGVTFLKHLTSVRIQQAKKLLSGGKYNVSEVAEMVGYKTSQYFGQIFYKSVGVTPYQYRKKGDSACSDTEKA